MNDIKGYRCPNCGSMIPLKGGKILKCEACGTEFEREDNDIRPVYVTTIQGEDVVIGTRIYGHEMEAFTHDPDGFLEYKLKGMAHELAQAILPYIELDVSHDIQTCGLAIRGKVRIGQPVHPLGTAWVEYPEIRRAR